MTIVDSVTRTYVAQGCHPPITVTAVLTGGAVHDAAVKAFDARRRGDPLPVPSGDLAVYEGVGSTEWVACYGIKASYAHAKAYFPDLSRAHYRD